MRETKEFFVRKFPPEANTCFVLMPFDEGLTAVYEHGIKPAVEGLGMKVRRADELYSGQSILGDVWQGIQSAEIIVADLTGKNPNVMYELGLCHALWKKVILLSQIRDDVPFDLRAWRVLWYDFTFAGAARLKEELVRTIEAIRDGEDVGEAQLLPLHEKVARGEDSSSGEWLFGKIIRWSPSSEFGFIRSGSEDFYFNEDYLFSEDSNPKEGDRVVFHPLNPVVEGKSRRASRILVNGETVRGTLTRFFPEKGFGFAQVLGQNDNRQNLFLLLADVPDLEEGARVRCTISENPKGPIGVNVSVIE